MQSELSFLSQHINDTAVNMDLDTFSRMLEILPYVMDHTSGGYGCFISCIFEPTIHPDFLKLLSILPEEHKNKCFFTTNFSRPMDEDFINGMLSANVFIINISIETLKPDRFEYITQNKKFKHFKNNLNLLEEVVNKRSDDIP